METLAALALFAMSTAIVGNFLTTQVRAGGSNESHVLAYQVGIDELESLRALPYQEIAPRTGEVQKRGMPYAVTTSVKDDVPEPGMKSIQVAVEWIEPGGTRHVVLETIDSAAAR